MVVTAAAAVAPVQVWEVLTTRTAEWWGEPYLGPEQGFMRLEPRLGGRLWSGAADASSGQLHGTVRACDPPERLEIGSVLVPGAYAGSITITIEKTALGPRSTSSRWRGAASRRAPRTASPTAGPR